jgi:hypothetical protein
MMKLNLDIVVDSPESEIDMQYGLETLKGTSDVISIAAEAILRQRVPDKRTHRSDVRTKLKGTFTGSYGQRFSLEIEDKKLKSRLRKIGDDIFLEVLSYFVMEALYIESKDLSDSASVIVDELSEISDKLTDRLKDPLIDMHKMATYFKYGIIIRQRKRTFTEPKSLIFLDENTAKNITEAIISDKVFETEVVVVRFHSITGNGRFYIKETGEIESFGFASEVKVVKEEVRKSISENLHKNNTILPEKGIPIKVALKSVSLKHGKVIKYLIAGVYV